MAREKLGGGSGKGSAQRELPNQERDTSSTGQGAQGARDTAQDTALPRDWQRPGEPRISKTFLPLGTPSCAGQLCRSKYTNSGLLSWSIQAPED